MKLNLGCGGRLIEGYVNVDNNAACKPDLVCDITKLPYPPNHFDEILSIHSFEHLYRHEARDVLRHWVSLLKSNGKLIIEVPCLDEIIENIRVGRAEMKLTLWALYGNQSRVAEGDIGMMHRWCYSRKELLTMVRDAGLRAQIVRKIRRPNRDVRVIGVKP